MSRRRQAPGNRTWACEVACADGHLPGKVATLTYIAEDIWGFETSDDLMADRRTLQIRKGAKVSAGGRFLVRGGRIVGRKATAMDRIREIKPDGGTKVRLSCAQCGRNLPISWTNLHPIVEKLWRAGVPKIQLRDLEAILKDSSREAGLS